MSCHIPKIESFIAIYLRHDRAQNRVIYLKDCRDKFAQGNQASAAEQQRVKREHDEQRGRQGTCDQRGQVQIVSGAASEGLGGRGEGM